jgi:Ca2+-binding EF-hand superfamily protein
MFAKIDKNNSGKVTLGELQAEMANVIGITKEDGLDVALVVKSAFDRASAAGSAHDGGGASATLEKREMRLFLANMRNLFELYQLWDELDDSDDNQCTVVEFKRGCAVIEQWGYKVTDVQAEFNGIDKSGKGTIDFDEFVNWAMSKNLDHPEDE